MRIFPHLATIRKVNNAQGSFLEAVEAMVIVSQLSVPA